MEARKTLTLMLAALALTACKYDDSELWEQVNRNTEHYTGIKVDFGDTQRLFMTCGETMAVDFTAEGSDRFTTDNLFTVAPYGWKAEVTLPARAVTGFILNVTAPADAASGAVEGDILVMLDNGQGIPPQKLHSLFDGALKCDESAPRDGKRNMGLGLSVCMAIVRAHGGTMEAKNTDHGAAFSFCLPLSKEDTRS